MSDKIDKTLKKIASKATHSNHAESNRIMGGAANLSDLPGDPNCPYCGGVGYLRMDLPVGHPDFGKLEICSCRNKQISEQIRQRLFELSHLDELSHLTLENFSPRGRLGLRAREASSLEMAYNQAVQYSRKLNGWLLIQGDYGTGKTHLAAAIANFAVGIGVPTLFITVPDLLDVLRAGYGDPDASFEVRFNDIRDAALLVLDDFGTQNATPWAQEKLFQILNYRYINRMAVVVTTNLSMDEIEPRIASRLEDPELVTQVKIYSPDYRQPIEDMHRVELSTLSSMHRLTFANFDLREKEGLSPGVQKSLKDAFKEAREFAEDPQGWLVLMGASGVGKTHLGAAIGNFCLEMDHSVTLVTVLDLLDHLRAAYNPNSSISMDRRFMQIKEEEVLILDDYGAQSTSPWAREKLSQLIDYRYVRAMPTVITTTVEMDNLDARLHTRISDGRLCKIITISAPKYKSKPVERRKPRTKRRY